MSALSGLPHELIGYIAWLATDGVWPAPASLCPGRTARPKRGVKADEASVVTYLRQQCRVLLRWRRTCRTWRDSPALPSRQSMLVWLRTHQHTWLVRQHVPAPWHTLSEALPRPPPMTLTPLLTMGPGVGVKQMQRLCKVLSVDTSAFGYSLVLSNGRRWYTCNDQSRQWMAVLVRHARAHRANATLTLPLVLRQCASKVLPLDEMELSHDGARVCHARSGFSTTTYDALTRLFWVKCTTAGKRVRRGDQLRQWATQAYRWAQRNQKKKRSRRVTQS